MNRYKIETYEHALDWIHGMLKFGMKPGLKRMEWFMEKLGHPEHRLKFIHVAGTNGKGSTSSFLAHMLQAAGYDTGLFTSPYLEKFTNRIKHNGEDIAEEVLVELCQQIQPLVEELAETELGAPTEFEVVTALAILFYATKSFPDYVVWETGLGGRLDSTNIVIPIISVITNIGMDHTDILGHTIEAIAAEKAGIIKPGVPVVTGSDHPDALQVLKEAAQRTKSTLYRLHHEFKVEDIQLDGAQTTFDFTGPFREIKHAAIQLKGRHQAANAAVAIMALEVLRQYMALILDEEDLRKGLLQTTWPGRFERIPGEQEIIIDGAHNPNGAQALAEGLQIYYPGRTIRLLIGILADKPIEDFLKPLLPLVHSVTVTQPDFRRAAKAEMLADKVKELTSDLPMTVEPDWRKALEYTLNSALATDLVVITGSLYMISDIRAALLQQPMEKVGEKI